VTDTTTRRKRAMASVYLGDDDTPFIVAETPREIAEMVRAAIRDGDPLIELTLANASDWNGKPLIARADRVTAVSPPKDQDEDE
jgi:2-keto-3-deoxy-6-phosphogluconate aldolase